MVADFWPIKVLISAISSVICFLFGGSEIILLVVMVFVVIDTITKWTAVTKQFLIDSGIPSNKLCTTSMICGFLHAWKPGYLTSTDLKRCWGEKIFTYGILVVFAGMMVKLPEILIAGTQLNKAISGGIYSYIAMTELFSIMENFEEMGNKKIALLKQYLGNLISKLTGTNFSITISNKGGKEK